RRGPAGLAGAAVPAADRAGRGTGRARAGVGDHAGRAGLRPRGLEWLDGGATRGARAASRTGAATTDRGARGRRQPSAQGRGGAAAPSRAVVRGLSRRDQGSRPAAAGGDGAAHRGSRGNADAVLLPARPADREPAGFARHKTGSRADVVSHVWRVRLRDIKRDLGRTWGAPCGECGYATSNATSGGRGEPRVASAVTRHQTRPRADVVSAPPLL